MKSIILTHYTIKNISPEPWRKTRENMEKVCLRMAPKLEPMGIGLKACGVVMDELTQDNLMTANMVTIASPEGAVRETPIENILGLELDFTPCSECRTPSGQEFPCRTFKNFNGEECQALPEEFFMEVLLRTAYGVSHSGCGDGCGSCGGCSDEEHSCGCKDGCRECGGGD